ncbi:MAG: A/G-specific adenine glycosylase [Planctomycetota bacterium]|jgi:A/G-specific adenine glycosylase
MAPSSTADVVRGLLTWFEGARRDLPWRRDPSPWRVLVAEVMLQQTRVATVLPRYEAFLARFPDPGSMAAADEEEVLALWSGLGYYRRARNLRAAARVMVERHAGAVPADPEALRALPGIGAYTAGAVLSIAFGRAEPVVDGNVERVLSRAFLVRGNVKRGEARRSLWELARDLVERGPPDRVNQAVMELGALVCLPRAPRCAECPIARSCAARREGVEEDLPELPGRRGSVPLLLAVAVARRDGAVLLTRAPEGGLLAGTWGPPFATVPEDADPALTLRDAAFARGLDLAPVRHLGTVRHTITHHRIEARCYETHVAGEPEGESTRWVPESDLSRYGLSSLARKSFRFQFA